MSLQCLCPCSAYVLAVPHCALTALALTVLSLHSLHCTGSHCNLLHSLRSHCTALSLHSLHWLSLRSTLLTALSLYCALTSLTALALPALTSVCGRWSTRQPFAALCTQSKARVNAGLVERVVRDLAELLAAATGVTHWLDSLTGSTSASGTHSCSLWLWFIIVCCSPSPAPLSHMAVVDLVKRISFLQCSLCRSFHLHHHAGATTGTQDLDTFEVPLNHSLRFPPDCAITHCAASHSWLALAHYAAPQPL